MILLRSFYISKRNYNIDPCSLVLENKYLILHYPQGSNYLYTLQLDYAGIKTLYILKYPLIKKSVIWDVVLY